MTCPAAFTTPVFAFQVDVRWEDARTGIPKLPADVKIDLLFLDGIPKQYLEYLKAAESRLAPGAMIIADNAGVFADGGLRPYLEYVRNSAKYGSRFIESTYEWRDDVADGLEVSELLPEMELSPSTGYDDIRTI